MTSVLDEIIVGVREDLSVRQEKTSIEELKALAEKVPTALDPFPLFDEAGVNESPINRLTTGITLLSFA